MNDLLFPVMPPIPYPEDKAFWSQWPKVIQVHKNQSSLGLSIMTREVSSTVVSLHAEVAFRVVSLYTEMAFPLE